MCKHPFIGYPDGYTEKGKLHYKIMSYENAVKNNLQTPFKSNGENHYGEPIQIPCGKCYECRLDYARKWSDRCMLELKHHQSSYFITLTYDDDHLEKVKNDDGIPSLVKHDYQQFLKDLRQKLPYKIRYYMCGEYGSKNRRPHFHFIIFGLYLNDLQFYKRTPNGDLLYNSPFIDGIWKKGFAVIGDVTPRSCNYVARYVSKKADGYDKGFYEKYNITPEFTSMSLKPGIGYDSYSPNIFRKGYESISTEDGGIKIFPPRYYEKMYEDEFPDEYVAYKDGKTERMRNKTVDQERTDSRDYLDILKSEEDDLINRTKSLLRPI